MRIPDKNSRRDWVERLGYKVSILSVTPNLRGNQPNNLDHTQVYSKRPRLFQDLTGSVPSLANAQEKAEYLLFSNPEENTLGTKSLFLPRPVTIPLIFSLLGRMVLDTSDLFFATSYHSQLNCPVKKNLDRGDGPWHKQYSRGTP